MTETPNRKTVMSFFAALGRSDFDALRSVTSEVISYTIYGKDSVPKDIAPWSGEHVGFNALKAAFESIHQVLDVHSFDVQTVLEEGNIVAVFGKYEATHRATGKRFASAFAQRVELSEGRVAACLMLEDSYTVFKSVGT